MRLFNITENANQIFAHAEEYKTIDILNVKCPSMLHVNQQRQTQQALAWYKQTLKSVKNNNILIKNPIQIFHEQRSD